MVTEYWLGWYRRLSWISWVGVIEAIVLGGGMARAQITPDTTLGAEGSVVTPGVVIRGTVSDRIDGGDQRGGNLFHSFSQFNVGDGQRVYFANPIDVQNILTRVTGGTVSNIEGVLGVDGNANLFLLNPNGILFGPNARLDLQGSFVASTAKSINFADASQFSTTPNQTTSLLTISVPIGLQFGTNPGQILVRGDGQGTRLTNDLIDTPNALRLASNQTLALVGGDVVLEGGTLKSTGGRIELGSVGADSLVTLVPLADGWTLDYGGVQNFRDIQLLQQATVDASGIGGGNVRLQGRQIILKAGSQIESSTLGFQSGRTLEVNGTESIQIDGSGSNLLTGLFAQVYPGANGNAGNIVLKTGSLVGSNGAQIDSTTFGRGNAGNVTINSDFLAFDGFGSNGFLSGIYSSVGIGAIGNSGNIELITGALALTNGARVGTATYGRGNAGSITFQVRDTTSLSGNANNPSVDDLFSFLKPRFPSAVFSLVDSGAIGRGGDIRLSTGSLSITNGAQIGAITRGLGDAGGVFINAKDWVVISGSMSGIVSVPVFPQRNQIARGNSGGIQIRARALQIDDGAQLLASTFFQGNAGKIVIDVDDSLVLTNGAAIFSTVSGSGGSQNVTGNSGGIEIRARSVEITDSKIAASTFSQGNAGKIFIQSDTVDLVDSNVFSTVDLPSFFTRSRDSQQIPMGVSSGGIEIRARSLSLSDKAKLATSTFAQGNAGDIVLSIDGDILVLGGESIRSSEEEFLVNPINALEIRLPGVGFFPSLSNAASTGIFSTVESKAVGNAGNINIQARSLTLTNGAQVQSLTQGQGNAGTIKVSTSDFVHVLGVAPATLITLGKDFVAGGFSSGFISSSESGAIGQGGDIHIRTGTLRVSEGAVLSARTRSNFKGGDINVNANSLEATDGGQLLTSTFSGGSAGNLTLNLTGNVTLSGTDPTFMSRLQQFGPELVDNDGERSGLFSRAQGMGSPDSAAGQINVSARTIVLDNQGTITAETTSGQGGEINLNTQELLLLRRNSQISTTAGTAQQGGDGGNITINSSFIVAVPKENSDIKANAFEGRGGNINITTQGIYGLQFRPRLTPLSDITASSEFGLDGEFQLDLLTNVDPSRGLAQLPINVVDASEQIDRRCTPEGANQGSSFIITGRGGIPPSPNEPLQADLAIANWVTLDSDTETNTPPSATTTRSSVPKKLVEAQGWMLNEQGQVVLTASAPKITPHGEWIADVECASSQIQ